MKNTALLNESSPFHTLFPKGVPIKNIALPNKAICEGDGPAQDVYMVDLDKIPEPDLSKLIEMVRVACTPDCPPEVARKEILARGLPLRAKHVSSVTTDVPFFL